MNLATVSLKSSVPSPPYLGSPIPRLLLNSPISYLSRSRWFSVFGGGNAGSVVSLYHLNHRRDSSCFCSFNNIYGYNDAVVKDFDIATLGNLCVDIVLGVPQLPPAAPEDRKSYMEQLSSCPPDKQFWEAGGNCNTAISAARLGLHCAAIGHVGDEIYGQFLLDVLDTEGIAMIGMNEDGDKNGSEASYETLLCWVLVDPMQRHGFCSRADFMKEPAFSWMTELSGDVKMAIRQSKILFCNGYGFDDLSPALIMTTIDYAVEVGTSIFFDPGPRGKSLSRGSPEERQALDRFMQHSDVLLLTADEAKSLTGMDDPVLAGQTLLRQGTQTKWVVIKMGSKGSIIITKSTIACAPAFKVNIVDTVGCGDSFVAAIAFGFIHKFPLVSTLTIANAVGAATAMGSGAGRNVATLDQVLKIIRAADINEDEKFWTSLLRGKSDSYKIILLSKMAISERNCGSTLVSLQNVVPQLLPKLQPPSRIKDVVPS
ncbi:hypothetical protein SAY87_000926 [Trapa incisa]|uniref:Carbohydrate kinase PfkB domain-containing protein n=1 Tax=Trapa incisa TaxID=236973 RepID=A0AAN7GCE9_9MYRT|nr:hypothetical protein SAY87_000926 [Trapa incisa]